MLLHMLCSGHIQCCSISYIRKRGQELIDAYRKNVVPGQSWHAKRAENVHAIQLYS